MPNSCSFLCYIVSVYFLQVWSQKKDSHDASFLLLSTLSLSSKPAYVKSTTTHNVLLPLLHVHVHSCTVGTEGWVGMDCLFFSFLFLFHSTTGVLYTCTFMYMYLLSVCHAQVIDCVAFCVTCI